MPGGKPFYLILGFVIAAPVAVFAYWLLAPLFITNTVNEEFPLTANATIPEGMDRAEAEMIMSGMAQMEETVVEAMPAASADQSSPVRLKSGEFRDGDRLHKGRGQALIYDLADGSRVLRFEDFNVTNGPDLRVILTTVASPESSDDVHEPGYIELDKLKGNAGSQNYPIPPSANVEDFKSVVIYCKPFRVIFAVAPLT